MKPLDLEDMAVLAAMRRAQDPVTIDRLADTVAHPPAGPGLHLKPDTIRRVVGKLRARGLATSSPHGWTLTDQGRALWASKGNRFTL
ncbi:hypothetical protein ACIP5Y_07520 [Nocardia sp. NPDC088792]|uniref:hypothetical protein n=1 Tax=Nocardia sp. NPDC088792 TaxID=3364332 RepID=UPI0038045011